MSQIMNHVFYVGFDIAVQVASEMPVCRFSCLNIHICGIYISFISILSIAAFDYFCRFKIAESKDAPNPAVGAPLLQQQVPGSETCSFMQPDRPGLGTWSLV